MDIQLGSHNKLDMNNIVCNSDKVVDKNNLVDNQDFFHSKQIPFDVEMNDTLHEQNPPNEMIK